MAANFTVKFLVNRTSGTYQIQLTDTSSGFTFSKANFKITYPNGIVVENTDFNNPDISSAGGTTNKDIKFDVNNKVLTGTYTIVINAKDSSNNDHTATKSFNFVWKEPVPDISNTSDVLTPLVKFKDNTSGYDVGNFTETINTRTLSSSFPSSSAVSGASAISNTGTSNFGSLEINMVNSNNYYEGDYTPSLSIDVTYAHTADTYLSVQYIKSYSETISIKRAPTQNELLEKINQYKDDIDTYKNTNPAVFNRLSEQYDLVIGLYSHIIDRTNAALTAGSEASLRELLDIVEPNASHTFQSSPINQFSTSDTESTQDIIGGMVETNTENGISVTYNDTTAKLNFDVADFTITQTGDTTGTVTVTNLANATLNSTLATVNSTTGAFGSTTAIPVITVNGKGLITNVQTAAISTVLTLAVDGGGSDTVTIGTDTLTISGGTGLTTTISDNNISVAIDSTVATLTGSQTLTNKTISFQDNLKAKFGTGDDLEIYHDGSNSYIKNTNGILNIIQNDTDTSAKIVFKVDTSVSGNSDPQPQTFFEVDGNINRVKYFKPAMFADGVTAEFGNLSDLQINHNGTDTTIRNNTGDLYIREDITDKDIILQATGSSVSQVDMIRVDGSTHEVKLYYDGNQKLKTTNTGISITGKIANLTDPSSAQDAATKAYVDSQILTKDNTDEITEGSSNLYFTNERVDDRVNALLQAGSNVSLSYDDAANTLTISSTQLTNEQVQDVIGGMLGGDETGGISVTYDDTNNEIDFALSSIPNSSLTNSSITVNGTTIALGASGTLDTGDIGEGSNLYFTNERVDDRVNALLQAGSNVSLTYDDTANTLTIAATQLTNEEVQDIIGGMLGGDETGGISVTYDDTNNEIDFTISNVPNSSLANSSVTINGTAVSLGGSITLDTDDIGEGSSNLYFTNARARGAISENSTQLSYDSSTGVLTYTQGNTDTVSEGSSNLYYTDARVQAVSINNVVEDTTPQLGGTLDTNGNLIQFGDSASTTDDRLQFGASQDLQIYHDGTQSIIEDIGTGQLKILAENTLYLGSATGNETYIKAVKNGAVELYHDNDKKLETTSTGISIPTGEDIYIVYGKLIQQNALEIFRDGTTATLKALNGDIRFINNDAGTEKLVFRINSNTAELYYNSSKKLNTTNTGIDVTGTATATAFSGPLTGNVTGNVTGNLTGDVTGNLTGDVTGDVTGNLTGNVTGNVTGNATGLSGTPNITVGTISSGNITTSGYLRGPASFTIDPATHGDNTGTVVIAGNLQVDGTTTTINSTTVAIDDLNFSIATDAADSASANGAGITIGGASATLTYTHADTSWNFNKPLNVTGNITTTGSITRSSGTLNINASNLALNNAAATKTYILGTDGGSVQLRHNDNTKVETTSTGISVTGDVIASGDVRVPDGEFLSAGNSNDLTITNTGVHALITNYTGNLTLQNLADDSDIIFKSDDGSGGLATYFALDGSDVMMKAHKKLRFLDSVHLTLGNSDDLKIYHDGTDSVIQNETGDLEFQNRQNDGDIKFKSDDGSGGVAEYFVIDGTSGENVFYKPTGHRDNIKANWGNGNDLQIFHGGVDSYIVNETGNLQLIQKANDKDIQFFSDDGSGGFTEYFRVDGSGILTFFSKPLQMADNQKIFAGDAGDLQIYHNGTHSYIDDAGTGKLILRGNTDVEIHKYTGEYMITATADGAVSLYFDDSKKLETTSAGIKLPSYGAGYLKTDADGNVSVDTSTIEDTLQTVTDRGSTTTNTMQGTRLGLGGAPHASAALQITTTAQHMRLNNGSELGIIHLLSGGELELWAHGNDETINFRTGSGSGVLAAHIDGTNTTFEGDVTINSDNLTLTTAASIPLLSLETSHASGIPIVNLKGAASSQIRYQDENGTIQSRIDLLDGGAFSFINVPSSTTHLGIDSSGNATFEGRVIIGNDAITTDKPGLVVGDTTNNGQITIRGQQPTLFFDKTGANNAVILTDAVSLKFKNGTIDSEGSDQLTLDTSGNATFEGVVKADGNVALGNISGVARLQHEGSGQLKMLSSGDAHIATFTSTGTTFAGHVKAPFFTTDGGRGFKQDSVAFVSTYSNGSDADAVNDLGKETNRWRDLYLYGDIKGYNGLVINSINQDKDIVFKGNQGGSTVTALTLDMSEGGNATFAGYVGIGRQPVSALHLRYSSGSYGSDSTSGFINEALTGRATMRLRSITDNPAELFFDVNGAIRWDISCRNGASPNLQFYPQAATPSLTGVAAHTFELQQDGDVVVTGAGSSGVFRAVNATFTGTVAAEDNIHLTDAGTVRAKLLLNASDRDNVELRAESLGSTMKFFTVGIEALELDDSQNATFAGNITAGSTSLAASNNYVLDVKKAYSSGNGHVAYFGAGTDIAAKTNFDTVVVAQDDVPCLAIIEGNDPNTHSTQQALRLAVGDNNAVISASNTSGGLLFFVDRATTATGFATNSGTRALHLLNNGNATFAGNVELGDSTNISMSSGGAGQLQVEGNGYTGAIALNATAMYIYHNSSIRDLVLGTNETARLTIAGNSGNTTVTGTMTATHFYGDGSNLTGVTGEWDGSLTGNASITGNLTVTGDIINTSSTSIISNGAYLEIGTGASNTAQLTFNADYDGGQTATYTPHYAGASSAGMSIIKMPSGGVGGLEFYVKKHGTTGGSHALSTFTKILNLHQDGYAKFAGDVTVQQTGDVYLTLESTDGSTPEEVAIKYNNQSTGSNYWWSGLNQQANWSLAYGSSFSAANTQFTVDTTGYVAIGGHAPTMALDVRGTTNLASRFKFQKDLSTDKVLFGGADHDDFDTFVGSSSNHSFTITQNGAAAITIDTSKNVGIGESNPSNYDVSDNPILAVGSTSTPAYSSQISILSGSSGYGYLLFGDGTGASSYVGQIRYYHSDNSLQFQTAGSERMRLDSSGRLGLGTSSPNAKLHIEDTTTNGNIARFKDISGTSQQFLDISSIANGMQIRTAFSTGISNQLNIETAGGSSFITLATNSTERMRILTGGNVAIGRTTADEKLHVGGTGKFDGDLHFGGAVLGQVYRPVESGSATDRFFLMFDYTNNASYPFLTNRTPNGAVVIKTGTAAGGGENEHFRIKGGDGTVDAYFTNTNLGIGTTSPDTILEVNTDTNNDGITLNGNSDNLRFNIKNDRVTSGKRAFSMMMSGSYPALIFQGLNDSYGFTRNIMAIEHDGNIGIGTITPLTKFVVSNGGASGIEFQPEVVTDTNGITHYDRTASAYMNSRTDALSQQFLISGSEKMRIDSDGRVMINQSSNITGQALQVNGFIDITKSTTNAIRFFDNTTFRGGLGLDSWATVGLASDITMFCEGAFGIVTGGGNTKKLVMDTSGNVGIGTASPDFELEVAGSIGIDDYIYHNGDHNTYIRAQGDQWTFRTGGDDRMHIDNTGVGIGTTSPDQKLHVEFSNTDTSFSGGSGGAWGSEGIRIENTSNTAGTMAMLHLRNKDADIHIAGIRRAADDSDLGFFFEGTQKVLFENDGSATFAGDVTIQNSSPQITLLDTTNNTDALIYSDDTGGINISADENNEQGSSTIKFYIDGGQKATLDNNGNFALGTNSPTNNSNYNTLDIRDTAGGQILLGRTDFDFFLYSSSTSSHLGTATGQDLIFHTNSSGSNNERMRIESDGTVQITNSTSPKLQLKRGTKEYTSRVDNANKFVIQEEGGNEFFVVESGASSNSIRIDSSGNVGIGTTNPSYKLDIEQSAENKIRVLATGNTSSGLILQSKAGATVVGTSEIENTNVGNLLFKTGTTSSSERMRLDSTGNVLVGKTSGTSGNKIETDGRISAGAGSAGQPTFNCEGDTNTGINLPESDRIQFITGGTERMRILSDGKVGIGTASPDAKLMVNTADQLIARFKSSNTGRTGIRIQGVDTSASDAVFVDWVYDAENRKYGFGEGTASGELPINSGLSHCDIVFDNAKVGIGTTSPNAKLEISGTSEARYLQVDAIAGFAGISSSMGAMVEFFNSGDGNNVKIKTNNSSRTDAAPFSVWTDSNSRFLIRNDGNVAIGHASPTQKLDVRGGTGGGTLTHAIFTGTSSRGLEIRTRSDVSGGQHSGCAEINSADSENDGGELAFSSNGNIRMFIKGDGKVGISTTSPAQKLHVHNSTASSVSYAKFSNAQTGATSGDGFDVGVNTTNEAVLWQRENSNILFAANNTERMRLDSSGRLLVNATSTSFNDKLYVNSDAYTTGGWRVGTSATFVGKLINDGGKLSLMSDGTRDVQLGSNNNASILYIDTSEENVGIGTTSPARPLSVNSTQISARFTSSSADSQIEIIDSSGTVVFGSSSGNAIVQAGGSERMRLESDGDLHVDGDVIAYSTTVSDKALKDNVLTLENSLDKVSKLRGVEYTWNATSRKGQKDIGVIAQEVEEVIPEIVREKKMALIEGGTYKTVDYEKLTAVLIEAVKELKGEVKELKKKLNK